MRLKQIFGAAAVAAVVMGISSQAEAAAIVYVTPTPVVVEVGDSFSVDVFIDADDPVGGFDMDVTWDSAILTWSIVSLHANQFDSPFTDLDVVGNTATGSVAGTPILDNLAGLPFKAFTLTFSAAALGISAIDIPYADLSNEDGTGLLDRAVQGGVVCVVTDKRSFNPQDCVVPVPEPGLLALLATGLATAAVRRRRVS